MNMNNLGGGGPPGPPGPNGALPEGPQQVSSLPLPPSTYISFYSDENIRRGRAPKPPPPPPSQDSYSMFGAPFHADDAIIRPLESQGIRRLYPQNFDHRRELKKLNHSVLVNFLDLLEILIKCPESGKRQEKIDDITLLFIHMHHLINEFRPHQARETLRVMMEMQKRSTLDVCDRFQKHLEKSVEIIRSALTSLPNQQNLNDDEPMDVKSIEEEADSLITSLNTIKASLQIPATTTTSENKSAIPEQDLDTMMCAIVDSL